ncbi:unnamed protein product [Symbiodinium natans]|uniref:Methyltransferase FkbM domain-containing protein n=1 Tax=Symbiodinium natans TaxID=878477 RepID=A0A812J863_9DINO|nr:unnamed protein product [Symbiodinium natans]
MTNSLPVCPALFCCSLAEHNQHLEAIAWLELFDQHRRFSLRKWSKAVPRGPCELDPDISAPPPVTSAKSPVAVCVEAAPRNYKLLREKQKKFKYDGDALRVVHAAASDSAKPGDTISFPDAPPGEERAGLSHNEHWKLVKVPLETVDTLVQRLRLPRVDAMLVDTEGADPAILAGSKQTLRMVRYLLFEVHRDIKGSHWSRQTLLSVVEMLDTLGFDCYWAGKSGSVASVTQCYEARFETIKWSNVACVKRGDVWWKVLEQRDPSHVVACTAQLYEHLCNFLYRHQFLYAWHLIRSEAAEAENAPGEGPFRELLRNVLTELANSKRNVWQSLQQQVSLVLMTLDFQYPALTEESFMHILHLTPPRARL